MSSIRYLPTEVQARFQAWASLPGYPGVRDEAWAAYVDARDNLPPGTTLKTQQARVQGAGFSVPSKLYRVQENKNAPFVSLPQSV